MQLLSVRVQMFRNFVDSGEVTFDPEVTALVGKNESGKTAVLQALRSLNPARGGSELDLHDDYPRWLKKAHEIEGTLKDAVPVDAVFRLTDDEAAELEAKWGPGVLATREVHATMAYGDGPFLDVEGNETAAVKAFLAACDSDVAGAVRGADDIDGLRSAFAQQISNAEPSADGTMPGNPALLDRLRAERDRLDALVPPGVGLDDALVSSLGDYLPTFFYFDEYDFLPGRADKARILAALESGDLDTLNKTLGEHTAAQFLKLAKTGASLGSQNYEITKAEMEAVAVLLSEQIQEYWKQNEYLRFGIDIEHETGPHPNGGNQIVREWVQFRVEDTRHRYSNNLDRRSTGFRWFVSFFASFAEFAAHKNVIVLLDEPGLSLHGRAQDDLLRFIDERLAPKHQVIYTTHSPWLVPTGHLDRVRIVEDNGPKTGATVTDQVVAHDPDTLFPLQAALGYDLGQQLFIGPDNLAVEGISDYLYLTLISNWLRDQNRIHLDPEWRVLPCGGIDNIPAFVALLGPHLDVTALIDTASKPNQRISNLIDRGVLEAKRLISVGLVLDLKEADIEDAFTEAEYLDLYNRTHNTKLGVKALKGTDRIVARIERAAGQPFDHGAVAETFLRLHADILPALSEDTLSRFEALFTAINGTRPR